MARLLSFAVALGVAAQKVSEHGLLEYEVDLSAAPEQRYTQVLEHFLEKRGDKAFRSTYDAWEKGLSLLLPDVWGAEVVAQSQRRWWEALSASHPAAAAEIRALGVKLKLGHVKLAALVSIYPLLNIAPKSPSDAPSEFSSACTSSLLALPGGVLHGRSLDYEPRGPMADTAVVVHHKRSTKVQYSCLQPLVYPTALQWFTCVRPKAFSLSVNARSRGIFMESNTTFDELLRRVSSSYLLGEIAEKAMGASSYEEALQILVSLPALSSNYFILAGAAGQGAIVTRFGNSSSADVWSLNSSKDLSDGQPSWLRVQTNIDHWVGFGKSYSTHRRQHMLDLMRTASRAQFEAAYFTSQALPGSETRTSPEDTGAILRPSTIATVFMDPNAEDVDLAQWHVWNATPRILPPKEFLAFA
ncbi:unnamed protein product [Effrenium voratum]|uniref:Uncharacterized protein n=1 Tax=Effrenium voratum TaxID=2562239 RepID=A0AA36MP14_9DINO|nr:unnamed protein product [Effrenium voratum]CAJ1423142.1 unnamed protein product [Effrenium voratum]